MLDQLISFSWLTTLVEIVLQVIMTIVAILLTPISMIISTYLPDFDNALRSLAQMFDYAITYMGWIISAFAIPSLVITAMIAYYTFVVLSKLTMWSIKLGISWYRAIK